MVDAMFAVRCAREADAFLFVGYVRAEANHALMSAIRAARRVRRHGE